MSNSFEQFARRVMSGEARGARAAVLRAALAAGEIPYSIATRFRNQIFNTSLRKPARLPKPVVSIGNITSGGTGKTPAVRWLAERLRSSGKTVPILSRGYKAQPGKLGDEQQMLASLLNRPGEPEIIIRADSKRARAGAEVLQQHPDVDVFLLDDGFQHRQLARDFDLVLINASEPFGYGRVLPRGMLREPLSGLRRASAFLLTRADQVNEAELTRIRETLKRYNPAAPIYESVHAATFFRTANSPDPLPIGALRDRRWFAFCGIAGPGSFFRQLTALGGTPAGHRAFADHHAYVDADIASLSREASERGADVLITTEKDWSKLRDRLALREMKLPLWRLDVELRFSGNDEVELLSAIDRSL